MFGMGWQEILVAVAVAVLVIGPDQLPQVARTIGKVFAQFKRAANDLRTAVSEEVNQHQELAEFKEFSSEIESEVRDFTHTAQDFVEKEMEKGEKELGAIEQEITASNGDPGPLSDPLPSYDYGADVSSSGEKGEGKPATGKAGMTGKTGKVTKVPAAGKAGKNSKAVKIPAAGKIAKGKKGSKAPNVPASGKVANGKKGGRKAGSTRKETA